MVVMNEVKAERKQTVTTSAMGRFFERYTYTTTHDGTPSGRPWTKVKVQDYIGDGRYLVKVLMLRGHRLAEPYETVDTLAHVLAR